MEVTIERVYDEPGEDGARPRRSAVAPRRLEGGGRPGRLDQGDRALVRENVRLLEEGGSLVNRVV